MQNQLEKLYNEEFFQSFVHVGHISIEGNHTFYDVLAYMDDRFIYIDNGDYRMMYPLASVQKIVLRTDDAK